MAVDAVEATEIATTQCTLRLNNFIAYCCAIDFLSASYAEHEACDVCNLPTTYAFLCIPSFGF
jgi:hypothetical protein